MKGEDFLCANQRKLKADGGFSFKSSQQIPFPWQGKIRLKLMLAIYICLVPHA
jgi:hypothetical protein